MTKYLLDTNVISELQKDTNCNQNVKNFIDNISFKDNFISVVSVNELWYGINKIKENNKEKYNKLNSWFNNFKILYKNNIVLLDFDIAIVWAEIRVKTKQKTIDIMDAMIGATALTHNLTLLTRNVKDFIGIEGLKIINPWDIN
ncbi:MAG: type II toxin-antitoxin system VapC family toxin [Rickettsiales bacterium]|nr:MAG: type II toxin-antitoxin system VapC family toxin [Rickettsiales bacterium]